MAWSAASKPNQNPIIVASTDAATGSWRAAQTLNTGNLPTNAQQYSGAVTRQWGFQVIKVVWTAPGASASFTITDANSTSPITLLTGATPASFTGQDVEYDFVNAAKWRDFSVSVLSAGSLLIWYRA